jgi:oligoendopeptidase F
VGELVKMSTRGPNTEGLGVDRDREKIPDRYKWETGDLYASIDEWTRAKVRLVADIPSIDRFRGRMLASAATLLGAMTLLSNLSKEYFRLSVYASVNSDADTRDSAWLARVQEMGQIGTDMAARSAFVQPEILEGGRERISSLLAEEAGLAPYRHDLDDILRRADHTGTEGEEKIIADAGLMADSPDGIYSIFADADFPFPSVSLSDGGCVRLDKAAFDLQRASPCREDRKAVFGAYFSKLNDFRRTFGSQLYAQVKRDLFYTRAQRYRSCLHQALDASNIPPEVYTRLIRNVNDSLPTFHRYLKLRRRMLALDELHYYDLYCPIVRDVDLRYSYEDAQKLIISSLAPLGDGYRETVRKAFADRWIDVYPSDGKRSGAYSNGFAYDVHPYILLNYNGKYEDVSALAHELGHTLHSHLSNRAQPYPTAHYSIFVAEVASTLNEALLMQHMLDTIGDDTVKLSLLGQYLDSVRGTVFRQTQFAEFELRIHEMTERGETLTGDLLSGIYREIAEKYYGHAGGICTLDDTIEAEWAHIPHFYYNFYVYQYSTSFTASTAISEKILAGDKGATERYLQLLAAGGSDYPVDLLKAAGVDMTTSAPFELTMQKMNRVMDEIERLWSGA